MTGPGLVPYEPSLLGRLVAERRTLIRCEHCGLNALVPTQYGEAVADAWRAAHNRYRGVVW